MKSVVASDLVYKSVFRLTKWIIGYLTDIKEFGKENLPETPYILALHHSLGVDGWVIRTLIDRRVHFWIQYEGSFDTGWRKVLELIDEIPIRTEGDRGDVLKSYFQAVRKSRAILGGTKDIVGIFIDGPKKKIIENGNGLTPLENRPNFSSAVSCSYEPGNEDYSALIVPVSSWTQAVNRKQFMRWGGKRTIENLLYAFCYSPIDYAVAYGTAFNPLEWRRKDELRGEIRKEQVRLYNFIRRD